MSLRSFAGQAAAAAAITCVASFATAGTLNTTGWVAPPPEIFTVTSPVSNDNDYTGGFTGDFNGVPINFWCFELNQYFNLGSPYTYEASDLADPVYYPAIGQLFNQHSFGATVSPVASAAFQLAIWEIRYDSAPGHLPYDLTTGQLTAVGDLPTIALANSWLNGLAGPSRVVTLLHSDTNHDFITIGSPGRDCCRDVPEPTTLPLMGLALGGMAFIASRRSRKARGL